MRHLTTLLAIFFALGISAQQHFCYTTEAQNEWFAKHPEYKVQFEKLQQEAAELDREQFKNGYNMASKPEAAGTYTIPIVFHILHTGGSENISDAQVEDAVRILNEDFNRLNSDTNNVVVQFKGIIGNAQIDFVLAKRDPQGNCTNGIIRHWDTRTNWSSGGFGNHVYSWPRNRYLNVYVVKSISSGAAGYTYLPGTGVPASSDAIVILNGYVGSMGTGTPGRARALTHEVGHWLNLPHTWGGTNQPGVACGDDGVSDTPVTQGFSSCNLNNANVCNPSIVENMQNYMDYAYCQRMFTNGQATRMQNAINSAVASRNNLSTPLNLAFTGITNPASNCLSKIDITSTAFTVCTGMTATLKSFTSNATPSSYFWYTDMPSTIQNPSNANTNITFNTPGITIVSLDVSNGSSVVTETLAVNVVNGAADYGSAYTESFEDPNAMLPAFWNVVNNTSPSVLWDVYGFAASTGASCMYIPGELLPANSIEILETPAFDFKNNPGATFSFKTAYAKQSTANKDIFKVQASANCGGSWTDIYVPSTTQLAQGSGGTTTDLYLMPTASHWKLYELTNHPNFTFFKNEPNVKIRFYFEGDNGGTGPSNRIYLDDVNFSVPVGVNELTRAIGFNVFPNPSNGEFSVQFTLSSNSNVTYKLVTVTGAELFSVSNTEYASGTHSIDLNTDKNLAAGIYFFNLEVNGVVMAKKLVVE